MYTSEPIFAEPFEQPALDRVENLQLGFDLLHLTNCIGGWHRPERDTGRHAWLRQQPCRCHRTQPFDLLDQVDHNSPPGGDNCCPLGAGVVAPQRLIAERTNIGVPIPNR